MEPKNLFIVHTSSDFSARSKELLKSQALSHTSRAYHRKRKDRRAAGDACRSTGHSSVEPPSRNSCQHKYRLGFATQRVPQQAPASVPNTRMLIVSGNSANEDRDDGMILSREVDKPTSDWLRRFGHSIPVPASTLELDNVCRMFWQTSAAASGSFSKLWKVQNTYTQDWLELFANETFAQVAATYVKYDYGQLVDPHGQNSADYLSQKVKALRFIRGRVAESGGVLDDVTVMAVLWLPFADEHRHDTPKAYWMLASQLFARSYRSNLLKSAAQIQHFEQTVNRFKSYVDYPTVTNRKITENGEEQGLPTTRDISLRTVHCSHSSLLRFPAGITALLNEQAIGPTTLACIERFLSFTATRPDGSTYLSIPSHFDTELPDTRVFIHAWDLYNTTPSSVPGEPSIELLLPTALMTYSGILSGPICQVSNQIRGCRAHICARLPSCVARRSKAEEYALFWISVVAMESWRTSMGDLRLEGRQMRDVMFKRFPWASHRNVAIPILKRFFYDESLLRNYGRVDKVLIGLNKD